MTAEVPTGMILPNIDSRSRRAVANQRFVRIVNHRSKERLVRQVQIKFREKLIQGPIFHECIQRLAADTSPCLCDVPVSQRTSARDDGQQRSVDGGDEDRQVEELRTVMKGEVNGARGCGANIESDAVDPTVDPLIELIGDERKMKGKR